MSERNVLGDIPISEIQSMLEAARGRLANPGLMSRDAIRADIRVLEHELSTRPKRDPRKAEDWFPPALVAAAKAAHAEHIRNLPRFATWDELPIQSQDDWIRIVSAGIDAYREAKDG